MSDTRYFDLSIPAPKRLALMRKHLAEHATKYPHCPEHVKPRTWRDVRAYTFKSWRAAFCAGFDQGLNDNEPIWYSHDTTGYFRRETACYNAIRTKSNGWYTDTRGDETAHGIVASLSHGRFIAGYHWCSNGETVYFPEVFTDMEDAARMSDEHARVFAESCREDDERYQAMTLAELDVESKTEELEKAFILRHRAKFGGFDRVLGAIARLRQARETLKDAARTCEGV